ncbi:MAG: ATP-grasp domain-containing protein [Nanobdellota archaeon]
MPTVFVTDANFNFSLPFVRALGRKDMTVVCGEEHKQALSFFSRYCKGALIYPSIKKDPDGFAKFMKTHNFDAIIPISDEATDFFAQRPEYKKKVALPAYKHYIQARDKSETMALADKQKVPRPRSTYLTKKQKSPYQFPVILKPTKDLGMRGVCIADNKDEYKQNRDFLLHKYKGCLVQEFIPFGGYNYCVDCLFDRKSKLVSLYMSKVHRTYPVYGGPDTFTETIYDEGLKDMALRLLKPLKWKGIVNVEFKEDPRTNELVLMEINPRSSSSISLSISAGLDFPSMLYEIITKGTTEKQFNYKTGIFQRQLATDLLHFIRHPDKKALFRRKQPIGPVHYTNIHWDDPGPLASHVVNLTKLIALPKFRKDHADLLLRSTRTSDKTYRRLYKDYEKKRRQKR